MEEIRLKIVFREEENEQSYFYLEKSEVDRVLSIFKNANFFIEWTSATTISRMIHSKLPATISTLLKLAGAERIEIEDSGRNTVQKISPVFYIRKDRHNKKANLPRHRYLKAPVLVKFAIRK